jgi:hypothetical protein
MIILFLIACVLAACSLATLAVRQRDGIILLLISMPVIATTWNFRFAGTSLIQITYGLTVPLLLLHRKRLPPCFPAYWTKCAWCLFVANVLGLISAPLFFAPGIIEVVTVILLAMNLLIGFYMFPMFFTTRDDFRLLLAALMISGIFPTTVSLYQAMTGVVWQERTIMGILRYDGLYHDSVACRIFIMPAFFAVIIGYLGKFFRVGWLRFVMLFYALAMLVALYNLSSRAVFGILAIWSIGLATLYRRWGYGFLAIAIIFLANHFYDNFLFERIQFLFSKEVAIYEGSMEGKYFLSGRGMLWSEFLREFDQFGFLAFLFGAGWTVPAHNEIIRIFLFSGLTGVILFSGSVLRLFLECGRRLSRHELPQVVAFLLISSFLIDSIGVTSGIYPSYNWFLWGMLGLLLFQGQVFFASEVGNNVQGK